MADENGDNVNGNQMRVDSALVRELAELLSANELTEIEVEDGDRKIRVRRELTVAAAPVTYAPAPAAPSPAPAAPAPAATPETASETMMSGEIVRSPMVGTAYLSAEPGSKPFVSAGETVKAGDTLLIVEAMKVMNPITAPNGGVVKQIMISNAQPVEYDQPLIVIE
jgi:acetyl-CoA carboxylase biotin carboxyl carrier protein